MRNSSQPPRSPSQAHRPSPEADLQQFGPEIARLLERQGLEWTQAFGQAVQAEMERALVRGLAAAFSTLAEQLPRLLAETCRDARLPAAEGPGTLPLGENRHAAETRTDLPLSQTTELPALPPSR